MIWIKLANNPLRRTFTQANLKTTQKMKPVTPWLMFWLFGWPTLFLLGASAITASPTVNAHALSYYQLGQNQNTSLSTLAMNTEPTGSTILAGIGRDNIAAFTKAPTDNLVHSPYLQLGPTHSYEPQYPDSGTALYAFAAAKGGAGHIITANTIANDEITMVAVEVKNGGVIQDYKWNAVLKGSPLTSLSVTTTGPATLVAFWWGDGNESIAHRAVPNNGFTVIDSLLPTGLLVQTAVATKDVPAAGSYNVTWDSGGLEGAQLYLVAVQSAPPALQAYGSAGSLVVSWPISGDYNLEITTNLSVTNSWISATNQPVTVGALNFITNSTAWGGEFFRLEKP